MADSGTAHPLPPDPDWYRSVFASASTPCTVLTANLVVVDVNAAFTAVTGRRAAELIGRDLFEAFPNNPDAVGEDHAAAVRASLQRARDHRVTDQLTELRYDIPTAGGGFETPYWNVINAPVLDDAGTLIAVLNQVADVTSTVVERAARDRASALATELQTQVAAAQADLLARATELQRLNERLRTSSAHDRSVAHALQSAMLTHLPEPDHLHLTARYLTATGTEQVGGDWYDAITLADGTTTLMVGDVLGHDIDAAGLMGQLRSMLRAFAWDYGEPPSRIVSLLDRAMRDLAINTMTSLIVLGIEQTEHDRARGLRTLRWTNAGHPPPVLLLPDGTTALLTTAISEPLLGVRPEFARTDHTRTVAPGTTLLLYTDGLIETRAHDLDHGLERVRHSLQTHHRLPTDDMLDAVLADTVGDHPDDDVAVLAVRFHPEDRPRPADAGPAHL